MLSSNEASDLLVASPPPDLEPDAVSSPAPPSSATLSSPISWAEKSLDLDIEPPSIFLSYEESFLGVMVDDDDLSGVSVKREY